MKSTIFAKTVIITSYLAEVSTVTPLPLGAFFFGVDFGFAFGRLTPLTTARGGLE